MSTRSGFLLLAGLLAGVLWTSPLRAQDGSNAWIDAARRAPVAASAPGVPLPSRRPKPSRAADISPTAAVTPGSPPLPERAPSEPAGQGEKAETPEKDATPPAATRAARVEPEPEKTAPPLQPGPTWRHELAALQALGSKVEPPPPEPKPVAVPEAAPEAEQSAAPARMAIAPVPPRKPAKPARAASPPAEDAPSKKKPPAGTSDQSKKCAALGKCRAAFARCKAEFIKKEGEWDLEKEPCGAKYKVCVRENFHEGEMFFTRWFWPYEDCP